MLFRHHQHHSLQLYKAIVIFVICVEFIILVCFSVYFSHAASKLLYQSNLKVFEQISFTAEQMDKQFKNDVASMLLNESVAALLNSHEPETSEIMKLFPYLREVRLSHTAIHSVYIYDFAIDTFYISARQDMIRKGQEFYDADIKYLIDETDALAMPVYRNIPSTVIGNDSGTDVLTYILSVRYNQTDASTSAVIINVGVSDFIKSITGVDNYSDYEQFFMFDMTGNVIAAKPEKNSNHDMAKIYEKIAGSDSDSGFFVKRTSGKKFFYSYMRSDSLNQTLVYRMPYHYLMDSLFSVRIKMLLIVCALLLLICVLWFTLSRGLIDPMYAVTDKLKTFVDHESEQEDNYTISTILNSIDKTMVKMQKLDTFKRENISIVQSVRLRRFLLNGSASDKPAPIDDRLKKFQNYCVMIFRIDRYYEFKKLSQVDQAHYKYAFMNIAQELISEYLPCMLVDMDGDHIAVIINYDHSVSPENRLAESAEKIRAYYSQYFGFSVSGFLSQPAQSIEDLPKLYSNAYEISFYRMHYEYGCFLTYETILQGKYLETLVQPKDIHPLLSLINLSRCEAALELLHSLIETLRSYAYFSLMTSVSIICTMIYEPFSRLKDNGGINLQLYSLFDHILECETLSQIETRIGEVIASICDFEKNALTDRSSNVIEKTISFIKIHYSDEGLCTKTIAEYVKLSPRYLSKLFYDNQQQSIQAYINQYRIEKAKQMLIETTYTVKEICARIGWPNMKHFYNSFKKQTGLTPIGYRNEHISPKKEE